MAISPGVHLETLTGFERKGIIHAENKLKMGGEYGPRSVNQELHTQPAQEQCGGLCGATE